MDDSTCVICSEAVELFVVGSCDHPVCHRCSVRLRSICESNQCPVCREDLPTVVVSTTLRPFASYQNSRNLAEHKALGMRFEKRELRTVVSDLFVGHCSLCTELPANARFHTLKEHMRRCHGMYYCSICEEHTNLFADERKCYSKADLERHMEDGDEDGVRKGHPECVFCSTRHLDNDELHTHLMRNHFWCHICEKKGDQVYYKDYNEVRKHFASAHFLCVQGTCAEKSLLSVFANRLDYQAHIAKEHRDGLSRSEARQARSLDATSFFDFGDGVAAHAATAAAATAASRDAASARRTANRRREDTRRTAPRGRQEEEDVRLGIALSLSVKDSGASAPASTQNNQGKKSRSDNRSSKAAVGSSKKEHAVDEHSTLTNSSASSRGRKRSPQPTSEPLAACEPAVAPEPVGMSSVAASTVSAQALADFPDLTSAAADHQPAASATAYASKLAPRVEMKPVQSKPPPGFSARLAADDFPSLGSAPASSAARAAAAAERDYPSLPRTSAGARPAAPPPGFATVVAPQAPVVSVAATSAPQWTANGSKQRGVGNASAPATRARQASHSPPGLAAASKPISGSHNGKPALGSIPKEVRSSATPATQAPDRPKAGKQKGGSKTKSADQHSSSDRTAPARPQSGNNGAVEAAARPQHQGRSEAVAEVSGGQYLSAIKLALAYSEDNIQLFKETSGQFYSGGLPASDYYELMQSLFGAKLNEIFHLTVGQLPSAKGDELLAASHNARVARQNQPRSERPVKQRSMPSAWAQPAAGSPPPRAPASRNNADEQNFPSLAAAGRAMPPASRTNADEQNFPSLAAAGRAMPPASRNNADEQNFPSLAAAGRAMPPASRNNVDEEDFPSLAAAGKALPPASKTGGKARPAPSHVDDFPALSSGNGRQLQTPLVAGPWARRAQ